MVYKQAALRTFGALVKYEKRLSFKAKLNFDRDVRGDGLAILQRRLVFVILQRFQRGPPQGGRTL